MQNDDGIALCEGNINVRYIDNFTVFDSDDNTIVLMVITPMIRNRKRGFGRTGVSAHPPTPITVRRAFIRPPTSASGLVSRGRKGGAVHAGSERVPGGAGAGVRSGAGQREAAPVRFWSHLVSGPSSILVNLVI